ncbi:hypothetical protein WJX82_000325 [Trebouxia sp. C0006]
MGKADGPSRGLHRAAFKLPFVTILVSRTQDRRMDNMLLLMLVGVRGAWASCGAAGAVLKRDQKAHEQQWQQPCSTAGVAVQHQDMSRHYGELKRFFTSCKALCYRLSSASKPT